MALATSVLRDHANAPLSICAHWDDDDPDEDQGVTTASMVWEPAEGRVHALARGQPCASGYSLYELSSFLDVVRELHKLPRKCGRVPFA